MNEKIVFLTFHNWETKRQGGFHKFAEIFAEKGWEVFFFSTPRPYYSYFKTDERLNKTVLQRLSKGVTYKVGKGILHNLTLPTFALPGMLRRFFPEKISRFLEKTSLKSTDQFFKEKFKGVTHFVFESNEALLYYSIVKRLFPEAKIIYRPSDPLCANKNNSEFFINLEKKLLFEADLVLLVNKENVDTVIKKYSEYRNYSNYKILNNGVDLDMYTKRYSIPKELNKTKTALYVGARDIEWNMIVEVAKLDHSINYIIICPELPNQTFLDYANKEDSNLTFIQGISPNEVPVYLTNANVIIVPNPKDRYKFKNWGITAKYLQAIAAKKPIVAYHDGDYLKDYNIDPVFNTEDFLSKINHAFSTPEVHYNFDLDSRDWNLLKEKFYNSTVNL
jgi:hypothetical protein